jgi:hypothetical protein
MFYVRSWCKWSDGDFYETRNVRYRELKAAEAGAIERLQNYRAMFRSTGTLVDQCVIIARPMGRTTPWGSHKRKDILRFELVNDTVKRIALI